MLQFVYDPPLNPTLHPSQFKNTVSCCKSSVQVVWYHKWQLFYCWDIKLFSILRGLWHKIDIWNDGHKNWQNWETDVWQRQDRPALNCLCKRSSSKFPCPSTFVLHFQTLFVLTFWSPASFLASSSLQPFVSFSPHLSSSSFCLLSSSTALWVSLSHHYSLSLPSHSLLGISLLAQFTQPAHFMSLIPFLSVFTGLGAGIDLLSVSPIICFLSYSQLCRLLLVASWWHITISHFRFSFIHLALLPPPTFYLNLSFPVFFLCLPALLCFFLLFFSFLYFFSFLSS